LQQIHAEFAEIKARNEAQQARVEDILSQRLSLEQQTKQVGGRGEGGGGASRPLWGDSALLPYIQLSAMTL